MSSEALAGIANAWSRGRGALLYGPPGTGKTRAISQLFRALQAEATATGRGLVLDPQQMDVPIDYPRVELPVPTPAKVVWTTFHQSYTYEDFVLGLRPVATPEGVLLEPRLGLLLDAVYELVRPDAHYQSVVLCIDELNRGNAARIFGEFLTFLDVDYRDVDASGVENPMRIPLPLRQLDLHGEATEPLRRATGELVTLPAPTYFPRHVYVVGTMNSVDRAAVPLDSALSRRFEKIPLRPDLDVLIDHFGLDPATVEARAVAVRAEDGDAWTSLSAYETAVLLLDRVNVFLASELGAEFELGHGLLMPVLADTEDGRWVRLAEVWDDVVFPEVEDRLAGRPDRLLELVKLDDPPDGEYAWRRRALLGGGIAGRSLAPVRLASLPPDLQRRSLQWFVR